MTISILVPLQNHARQVPALLRALGALKGGPHEILFLVGDATDGTPEMLTAARLPGAQVLREPRRGTAEALNRGIAASTGDSLLLLGADCLPAPSWATAFADALEKADLAVGATAHPLPRKASPYAALAAKLFTGHTERTARAQGHALPWGPASNLAVRRSLLEKVGPFSPDAGPAFDIDWCWRAMLAGAEIAYAPGAKATRAHAAERAELLAEFEAFGRGEVWLHRTYSFLTPDEDQSPDPASAAIAAFRRLRHFSAAAKAKPLATPLEETAVAFANGVRLGYELPHRECPIERVPPRGAIAWESGPKETTVFSPGRGLATLTGKQRQLFLAIRAGTPQAELVRLFRKLFKGTEHEAEHELAHFRENFS